MKDGKIFVDTNIIVYAYDISALLSEDFSDRQKIKGLDIKNPFADH